MKTVIEYAAGGIVMDKDKLLIVQVQNLEGQQVWTFPKGHVEPGEQPEDSARREVFEETGYRCQIIELFDHVRYWFQRDGHQVRKHVLWFLMKPVDKAGSPDPKEILDVKWATAPEASRHVRYKSDKRLLKKLQEQN